MFTNDLNTPIGATPLLAAARSNSSTTLSVHLLRLYLSYLAYCEDTQRSGDHAPAGCGFMLPKQRERLAVRSDHRSSRRGFVYRLSADDSSVSEIPLPIR